jgi:hypothetical protein
MTLRKHLTGYGGIDSFSSLLPAFTTGLIGLFATGNGPLLLCSFRCLLCFSQRDLRQFSFLPASVLCTHHFFSSATVYGQTDVMLTEPGLEDQRHLCLVLILKAVDSDLQPSLFYLLKAVSVAEVDGVRS